MPERGAASDAASGAAALPRRGRARAHAFRWRPSGWRSAPSDHFDGRRFFNPDVSTDRTLSEFLRWQRTARRAHWPDRVENARHPPPPPAAGPREVVATFIGQATFLIQLPGLNLLTDPIFSERAGPDGRFGPKRVRDPGVAFEDLPRIDLVLLSHSHYDHMDVPSLRRLRDHSDPLVLTGLGNRAYLARRGVRRSEEFDWWESFPLRGAARGHIHFVPAQHWSRRGFFDTRRTLWGGFVVEALDARVYFAGDTGYASSIFRAVAERLGPPDLALLPIGAYEPRWFMAAQHMNPDDAVRAHLDLRARRSLAMHFGTFQLTDEGMDAPVRDLAAARERHGVSGEAFRAPDFGEPLRLTCATAPS